jgi:DNA-directed RNA polymerase specialized sigma24 family protein
MVDDTLDEQDDESLALKVAADKDRRAASILVSRYAPKLLGYLTKNFGPNLKPHGVQDALQTTFLKMTAYIASYKREIAPFEAWMIRIAYNVAQEMLADKDKHTYETFTDEPVFYPAEPDDGEEDGKKDWRVKVLEDFIENKLKGFEQAVGRDYVATGGNIDAARLMREWGKTRNHLDVAKSVIKKKFQQVLIAAEKQKERERGKT